MQRQGWCAVLALVLAARSGETSEERGGSGASTHGESDRDGAVPRLEDTGGDAGS